MVIICRDIGCFMLALFHLENLMGDFLNIGCDFLSVGEGVLPLKSVFFCTPPLSNFFSGVELKLCLLSENVKILLKQ